MARYPILLLEAATTLRNGIDLPSILKFSHRRVISTLRISHRASGMDLTLMKAQNLIVKPQDAPTNLFLRF